MLRTSFRLVSIFVLLFLHGAWSQEKPGKRSGVAPEQSAAPQARRNQIRGLSLDYRIGAGDVLEIQVANAPELNQVLPVSAAGEINVLPAGTVVAAGLTAAELEDRVAGLLKDRKLLVEPEILIYIREYKAKQIYATGEFARPGQFVMSQNLTVFDAVLLAGGLGPGAGPFVYLHRRLPGSGLIGPPSAGAVERPEQEREGTEIVKIDLRPMQQGGTPEPDLLLQEGDSLILPRRQAEYFFVLGEVMRPLDYPLPDNGALTASQAIARAGGPTRTAKISQGMVVRLDDNGNRQEIKVDFKAILEGRQRDFEIHPNDIIFIPGSKIRTIGEGYVTAANAMIAGTAFRLGRMYQLPDRPDRTNPQ